MIAGLLCWFIDASVVRYLRDLISRAS
jgi:hypothetical protein